MSILCQACSAELETWSGKCPHCGGTASVQLKERVDPLLGKLVGGRYRITKKLGQGGMGSVYLAEHTGVGQRVAIKFLNPSFSGDPDIVRRFLNEARSYGAITHPHAVQLHDFGQDDEGNLFISMEFIEGTDLKRVLEQEKRLAPAEALDVLLQVCDALGYAHGKGIVHRDLKPENIMLVRGIRGWHAKVLDFGIARMMEEGTRVTAAGSICGTPRYMSPEQAEGGEVDHRTDVYALGLVLFECLTGWHPFTGNSIAETLKKQVLEPMPHLRDTAPDLQVPDALDAAVQKATAKIAAQRFQSMADFAQSLVAVLPSIQGAVSIVPGSSVRPVAPPAETVIKRADEPDKSAHAGSPYQRPPARSRGGMIAGVVAGVLLLGAGGAWVALSGPDEEPLTLDPASLEVQNPSKLPPVEPGPVASPPAENGQAPAQPAAGPGEAAGQGTQEAKAPPPLAAAAETKAPSSGADPATQAAAAQPGTPATPAVARLPVPSAKPATPDADREVKRVADQAVYGFAFNDFTAGRLATAAAQLRNISADSAVHAQAQALQQQIDELNAMLRKAEGLYRKGDCEGAIEAYEQVLKKNGQVASASEGIARCRKQMPASVIE